jgi:hypothetical protein
VSTSRGSEWEEFFSNPALLMMCIGFIIFIIKLVVWVIHGVGQWWHWLTSHF